MCSRGHHAGDAGTGAVIEPAYRYRAICLRVIDGDTFEFNVDLGMHVHCYAHIRLRDWSAFEMNTEAGKAAQVAAALILLAPAAQFVIETFKDRQTFGRWIADVWVNGVPLSVLLLEHLHFGKAMG